MATKSEELAKLSRGEGCLAKAALDEPMFFLRAQDRFAPNLVEQWAHTVAGVRRRAGDGDPYRGKPEEAIELADKMRAWQAANNTKTPD